MHSKLPAKDWEEAFPGGNGRIGILVMGNPKEEKIIVNHERLFLPMHGKVKMPEMAEHLPEIRRLIQIGNYREASALFATKSKEQGLADINPDFFHPAFDLRIFMFSTEIVSACLRSLDFTSGEITSSFTSNGTKIERKVFVSRPDNAIVMSIGAVNGIIPNCTLCLSESGMDTKDEQKALHAYIQKTEICATNDQLTFHCRYKNSGGYVGCAKVIQKAGTMKTVNGQILIKNASKLLIIASVAPNLDMEKLQSSLSALPANYETLFARHSNEHRELYNRVRLNLNTGTERLLSNEELLSKARVGDIPLALIERMHDFGRYLLICSSGELPPNAQGVWNGTWKISNLVDYVTNIELEMATWPALQGALPECLEGYFDFIESLLPDWHENATKLYACRGVLASSRSSNHGQLHHFSEEYPHEFWTAGAGWMAQTFYEYWLFTGDQVFLENRAIPLMKEVALFYEDFLIDDPNGCLQFIPSVSPENNPANSNSQAARNATMDIAIAKEMLGNLIEACIKLNLESENIDRWQILVQRLPNYQTNRDGSLREWIAPELEENYPHRHISHLYPAMPGFETENDANLATACKKAISARMRNGLLRRCGWSLGHAVNVAARLKDGTLVQKFLSEIATCFVKANLLTLLDSDLGMFQVDANLGFTAAVMEALVFSLPGKLELLPALPPQWTQGSISGIHCRGNITIKQLKWDVKSGHGSVIMSSPHKQQVCLKISSKIHDMIILNSNDEFKLDFMVFQK